MGQMLRIEAACAICGEAGYRYAIIDIVPRPYSSPDRHRECGLCELCRDLIASGWAMVREVAQEPSRP